MYFEHCRDLNELKAAYKRLAMENHPDRGGDLRTMQAINMEYDAMFERLQAAHNRKAERPDSKERRSTEKAEAFRNVVAALIRLKGLDIELCGAWLWIGGETYENREALKAAGCMYSRSKKKWYWRHAEDGARWSKGRATMGEIRRKYGSEKLYGVNRDEIAKTA